MSEDLPKKARGDILAWAIDMIVHHQLHLLNDRIVAQLVSESYVQARPHQRVRDLKDHLLAKPVPLTERTFQNATFRAAPVTFDGFSGKFAGTSILIYRPIGHDDGITIAHYADVLFHPNGGPSRVRWPLGLFEL